MASLSRTIEERWQLDPGKGQVYLVFALLSLVMMGTALFGMTVATPLILVEARWHLATAFAYAGAIGLAFCLLGQLLLRFFSRGGVFLFFTFVVFLIGVWARLLLSHSPVRGAIWLFVDAELFLYLLINWRVAIVTAALTEREWGRLQTVTRVTEGLGAIGGSLLALVWLPQGAYLTAASAFVWFLLCLLGCAIFARMVAGRPSGQRPRLAHRVRESWRVALANPLLIWILATVGWSRVVRIAMQGSTLSFYADLDWNLGLFFPLLFTALSLASFAFFVTLRPLLHRIGVSVASLIYPIFAIGVLAWWMADSTSLPAALTTSFTYFSVMTAIYVVGVRQIALVLPSGVVRLADTAARELVVPVGGLVGGLFLLVAPKPLHSLFTLWLVLASALVALLLGLGVWRAFRRRWHENLRQHAVRVGPRMPTNVRAEPAEIEELLQSEDTELQRVGLFLAARSPQPAQFMEAVETVLPHAQTPAQRSVALEYLRHLPSEDLKRLIDSDQPAVRARALAAVALHKIPVGLAAITTTLRDEESWVQLVACAAAWRLGMGKLAAVSFDSLSLFDIEDDALLEFLEIVGRDAPPETLRVLKQLACYPSPRVREAAMRTLAKALGGVTEGHADLLEVGIKGAAHEEPRIRAAAVDLLLASGADNRVDYFLFLLEDPAPMVRQASGRALAKLGTEAATLFTSSAPWVVESVIESLCLQGKPGQTLVYDFLKPHLERLGFWADLPKCLTREGGLWTPISTAIRNDIQRTLRYVHTALLAMGYQEAARCLARLSGDLVQDVRLQLLEALRRNAPPRYTRPLIPILTERGPEQPLLPAQNPRVDVHNPRVLSALQQLASSPDPFIQKGALMVQRGS